MIRRPKIVQARLTQDEFAKYNPLIAAYHWWTWSDLLRGLLKRFHDEHVKSTSDKSVIHNGAETKTPAKKSPAKKQTTRQAPSRRGKSKV